MGRDSAECTPAKATSVYVDREAYHVEGGNTFALVFGMWQTGVWQVERMVYLSGSHGGKRWVYNHKVFACLLNDALWLQAVALLFYMSEVGGIEFSVS